MRPNDVGHHRAKRISDRENGRALAPRSTDSTISQTHTTVSLMNPELRAFIDRVIVPALLERFLREHSQEPNRAPHAA
jgi:hypothetical protein